MKLVTAAQMREIDLWAIREIGIPGPVLMENAGACVIRAITSLLRPAGGFRVAVLCGKGNNGGDGFVVARRLLNMGAGVKVFVAGGIEGIGGDALLNLDILHKMSSPGERGNLIESIDRTADTGPGGGLASDLASFDLIVDALLGTGFSGEVREPVASVIRAVNRARGTGRPRVLSVDVPSGLDSTTGLPARDCVRADYTITFAYPKTGLVVYPGADYAGDVLVGDIGIPPGRGPASSVGVETIEPDVVRSWIGDRRANTHKGTYGHVLVVAGSSGLTGAAALCAEAALRCGAGLVTLGLPASLAPLMEVKLTEVMKLALPESRQGGENARVTLSREAAPAIAGFCRNASVLAFGPGISVGDEMRELTSQVVAEVDVPLVIDADGLNCLDPALLETRKGPAVVTPHPGEMSRLTRFTVHEIQGNRIGVATEFASKHSAVVVLKGERTVVASPGGRAYVNLTGNPGMASAGMGDILTGAIASLVGQGLDPLTAAASGVYLHGLAGDIAAEEVGPAGILAGDVLRRLPAARRVVTVFHGDLLSVSDVSLKPLDTTYTVRHRYRAERCPSSK
ncbi:MAG: NAD(P)H-hydrate dehydratase [Ignavibacteriales bacterium]